MQNYCITPENLTHTSTGKIDKNDLYEATVIAVTLAADKKHAHLTYQVESENFSRPYPLTPKGTPLFQADVEAILGKPLELKPDEKFELGTLIGKRACVSLMRKSDSHGYHMSLTGVFPVKSK